MRLTIVLFMLVLTGCGQEAPQVTVTGQSPEVCPSHQVVYSEVTEDDCEMLSMGIDLNDNGTLEDTEITKTVGVCPGHPNHGKGKNK